MTTAVQSILRHVPRPAAIDSETVAGSAFPRWVLPVAAICLLAIYVVGYDQGGLLYPLLGESSMKFNYVHEFVHDGRHLLGFACH